MAQPVPTLLGIKNKLSTEGTLLDHAIGYTTDLGKIILKVILDQIKIIAKKTI
jgi:hypothetical protein